jgi:GNAT superfamily N-acetyltransferase
LELKREAGLVSVRFHEVRLPRPTNLAYPYDPYSLADDWVRRSMMFTALAGENPVGYISLLERSSASAAWVSDLVVDAASRRMGVASALLASAQDWALSRSHRILILEMQSKNIPAIRLAQKFGFEFCGYNDHYYPTQDIALFFSRSLQ